MERSSFVNRIKDAVRARRKRAAKIAMNTVIYNSRFDMDEFGTETPDFAEESRIISSMGKIRGISL